ncbi:TetR/AcrR family transcriptional regulator [Desulfopila aestuarii]|uniref:Biofilm operon icaADBC HTH-type negative transcriptional regulator IcaR n=1 Tax=Desulfopila aestuarii DSM 18488 TaxID=1121416 RepID=A0A1M7YEQ6_9BACT|nr:TetR/AcrR family transcriptional regulator [Desulfopila aestuarii]SHO51110.1 transcriptional regulator, TetR family [Desulfopila aestuarii DSM 18488]
MKSRKNLNAAMRKPEILEGYYNVLIREGLENASISKIAKELGIHTSLIFHYFQSKENLTFELVRLMIEKFKSVHLLSFEHIEDPQQRYRALLDLIFSLQWSRTVDPGVHFGFYYQSFRDQRTLEHLREMFAWLRDYLEGQLKVFNEHGIIKVGNPRMAADYIVTLMEGMEFHAQFLAEDQPFENFAGGVKASVHQLLTSGAF